MTLWRKKKRRKHVRWDKEDRIRGWFGRPRKTDPYRLAPPRGGFHRRIATRRIGRVAVRSPGGYARRCVIKAHFVPVRTHGARALRMHLDYLERDGVGRDGSPGRLYGADEKFEGEDFRRSLEGEQRQFRFIVSPEDGDALDLAAFARRFMTQ